MAGVRAVVAAGAVLRLVSAAGITPTVYVDSIEYRGIALFGGRRRPWTVPLLHAIVGDATARVVAHAVIGAACWAALALALAEVVRHPKLRVGAAAAVMATGLVSPVTNYDTTILSETVAISLAALLVAAWVRMAAAPSPARAGALLATTVLFTFTRNDHPLLVTATFLAASYVAARTAARPWRIAAVGLAVTVVWGWLAVSRNDEIERFNLALVVANRVLPDEGATAFFVDRGMPLPAGDDVVLALSGDPDWNEWAAESGASTYARWLLSEPDHLLFGPWPDLFGTRATTLETAGQPAVLLAPGDRYGRIHPLLPEPFEAVLWGGSSAAPVVLGGLAVAGAAAVRRRRGAAALGPVAWVAAGAAALGVGHLYVVWHASPLELGRLSMVAATLVHAGLLVLGAMTVDRALDRGEGGDA